MITRPQPTEFAGCFLILLKDKLQFLLTVNGWRESAGATMVGVEKDANTDTTTLRMMSPPLPFNR